MTSQRVGYTSEEPVMDDKAYMSVAQKSLQDLKAKISSQSKKNFVLEKDVRYLDSRIALLIQNRMALEEVGDMTLHSIAG